MAHIEKRGPNKYRARYRDPSGKERSKTFARRVDAERFASTIEADKARGTWLDPSLARIGYATWADEWMGTNVHLKPKTRAGYESLMRSQVLPTFGRKPLGGIRATDVRKWISEMVASGLSASRIRQAYLLLSASMEAAEQSGYIGRSPCVGISLPRIGHREMRFLSASEVDRLASKCGDYSTLIYLLAYGGIRWGEAAALRRKRCRLLKSRIEIAESLAEVGGDLYFGETKTYQARAIAIPSFLRDLLGEHLALQGKAASDALVFTSPDRSPIRNSNFRNRIWVPALESLGWGEYVVENGRRRFKPNVRIHDLRHTCAALLIAQGAHPKAVQSHLGHASIAITMDRYGHLFPDDMDRLAESLDATFREASPGIQVEGTISELA